MHHEAIVAVLVFVVLFGALSKPLTSGWRSGPMVFTAFGLAWAAD